MPIAVPKTVLPREKLNDKPRCGKCGEMVLSIRPIEGTDYNFNRYLTDNGLPGGVDFGRLGVVLVSNLHLLSKTLLPRCRLKRAL